MSAIVYQALVRAGKLTVADLERFADDDRCRDAREALSLLAEEGRADAVEAMARIRAMEKSEREGAALGGEI